jgi:hypothetical protein
MAFRRDSQRARSWQRWLDQHQDTLIRCSLPEFLVSDELRWFRFIGHDGWDQETGWKVEVLAPEQAAALSDPIMSEYGCQEYRGLLRVLDTVGRNA